MISAMPNHTNASSAPHPLPFAPARIAVGSRNPVKVRAVATVAARVFPGAEIVPLAAPSGVAEQPRSDEESIRGAEGRARHALHATGADLAVGLEGGVAETAHGLLLTGWVVAIARDGRIGLGGGGGALLPDAVAAKVRGGGEVGPVMDDLLGESDLKKSRGAVGVLTAGLVNRDEAFERMVVYAFTPFLAPDLYAAEARP